MTDITEPTLKLCWNEHAIRRAAEVLRAAHLDLMAEDVEAQIPKPAIEEQVKPAIEEPPRWFGTIIRATGMDSKNTLWQPAFHIGDHYWINEFRDVVVWSELTDVEVLRVGVGDTSAYAKGATDTATKIQIRLRALAAEAITAEQQNAFMKAFEAVGEEA